MKIEVQYGKELLPLPEAALERLSTAGEADWRLLLLLCARDERGRRFREDFSPEAAAEALELSRGEVEAALAFWRGAGILRTSRRTAGGSEKSKPDDRPADPAPHRKTPAKSERQAEKPAKKAKDAPPFDAVARPEEGGKAQEEAPDAGENASAKAPANTASPAAAPLTVLHSDSEVHYTGKELAGIVQARPELERLLEECQHVAGKLFSTAESCKIITLADYYRFSPEYILLLFQYSQTVGKCSVPYVYRTGCELFRQEIRSTEQLEDYFRAQERKHTVEGAVRRLFGIGARTLSAKEKRFLAAWAEAGFSDVLITYAYEQTVDGTGEASMPYMNKILEKWKAAGITTIEHAQAAEAEYRSKKVEGGKPAPEAPGQKRERSRKGSEKSQSFHSFDPDEFFRTALEKSDEKAAKLREKEKGAKPPAMALPSGDEARQAQGGK